MMPKKKKIVQPAIDTNKPKEVKTEGIIEGTDKTPIPTDMIRKDLQPQEEKVGLEVEKPKPLTSEERIARMEQQIIQNARDLNQVGEFLNRLGPLVQLSDQVAEQKKAAAENPQAQQNNPLGGMQGLLPFLQMFMGQGGGGDSELAQLGNQYGKLVLKEAIANVGKPSVAERIGEAVLEGFVRKQASTAAKNLE